MISKILHKRIVGIALVILLIIQSIIVIIMLKHTRTYYRSIIRNIKFLQWTFRKQNMIDSFYTSKILHFYSMILFLSNEIEFKILYIYFQNRHESIIFHYIKSDYFIIQLYTIGKFRCDITKYNERNSLLHYFIYIVIFCYLTVIYKASIYVIVVLSHF